ncbi:uncharacterized protein EMH_0052870 [Eimeria mitis]|uniref:Uncharacterized protein n=1 Tax=Eimeria mitis TaxID=44415 RepID=U6JWK4_9EIME|nr:uncharacterized protein EMH_0052870 [Eimeria mitis]CDJ29814.1 hypothetical protein EMH_0052870 [Eimeria mitis]
MAATTAVLTPPNRQFCLSGMLSEVTGSTTSPWEASEAPPPKSSSSSARAAPGSIADAVRMASHALKKAYIELGEWHRKSGENSGNAKPGEKEDHCIGAGVDPVSNDRRAP